MTTVAAVVDVAAGILSVTQHSREIAVEKLMAPVHQSLHDGQIHYGYDRPCTRTHGRL